MERHTVCVRCAKIKQACDGGNPCSRCKRLDVVCIPSSFDTGHGAVAALVSKSVKITRTHTGCTSCKRRKRKCDEARPKCSDCRRLCLDCHYRELDAQTQTRKRAEAPQPTTTETSPTPTAAESIIARDLDDDAFDIGIEDFERVADWNGLDDSSALWSLTPRSHTSVDGSNASTTPSHMSLSLNMLSTAPSLAADEDRMLLNHYTKVVAVVMARRDDHRPNPFLSKVLPLALSNQLVMEAVLALSANHWKRLHPSIWKGGVVHQTKALQSLVKLLPRISNDSFDSALLTTLLLAMIDLFDGTSSHWKYHLDGVRRLLSAFKKKSDGRPPTEFRAFYSQLYHYLDSATTISTCQPPLLEAAKDKDPNSLPYSLDDEESLYGIPRSLFHFVDKLNGLAYQRKFRDDPVFESLFQASAASLQKEIEQWTEGYSRGKPEDVALGRTQESATHHATMAFEQALRLRLHQVVNGYSLDHKNVRQCVSNILESIQEIRYGSPLESSLIFPLVMAGGSCNTEHERQIIRDRFLIMERTLGFRYISIAYDLVQRVWKEREVQGDTGHEVNWAAIRYFNIPGLVLV